MNEADENRGTQVPNVSSVGFPRSLSNALMVGQHPKRDTRWRRLYKVWFAHSRRVR